MQMRALVTLSWPRPIGVASGTFGAALAIAFTAQVAASGSFGATLPELVTLICGCAFLFLAFPLYTGREWARRALLVTICATLAAVAISFSLFVVQRSSSASHPALRLLIGACALVAVLTPPAFILFVLRHADIKRAYRADEASNQPMERTADGSEARQN
jgi:hypothetical protein